MFQRSLVLLGTFFAATCIGECSAWAASVNTHCGAPISSIVVTGDINKNLSLNPPQFTNLSEAKAVVSVPVGATRCIQVRFSAEAACRGGPDATTCVVRVLDGSGNSRFDPQRDILFAEVPNSGNNSATARSFDWVKRVGAGSHAVSVQIKVGNPQTHFLVNGWTMNVEVSN